MKIKLRMISLLLLFSIICSVLSSSVEVNIHTRKLGVLYTKPYLVDNSLTGTGIKVKDTAYKAICSLLECSSGCCYGDINTMTCGDKPTCDNFKSYFTWESVKTVAYIIGSIFFCFLSICLREEGSLQEKSYKALVNLLFVIFLPCFLCICCWKAIGKGNGGNRRPPEPDVEFHNVVNINRNAHNNNYENININPNNHNMQNPSDNNYPK
jgi:hypothetical protein